MMPVNKLLGLVSLPQVEVTFVADIKASRFTKTCRFNPSDFPKLDSSCLETPLTVQQQDNPYREYHALKKLQILLQHNLSDGVPKLLNWKVAPGLTALTMELGDKGPLADYFSVRDREDLNNHIMHPSIPGPMEQKLSLLIRCLITLYLFAWMDIANNDLHAYNVVIATCKYNYAEIKYGRNVAETMIIPTFGIKPMIVDFGQATTCINTNLRGFNDTSILLNEFTDRSIFPVHADSGYILRTPRDEILQWALRYYAQLQDLLAEHAADKVRSDDAATASASASDKSCPQQTRTRTFDISNIADMIANNSETIKADIGCKCVIW